MEKIRDAVKKENNIIGTFYRNCGVHYREAESAEYETSPIVVVHNSAFTDTAVMKVRPFMNFSSTGTANCSARSTAKPARISMSPSDRYRPRDCLRLPTGWKNTGSSPLMSMTTRLSYARGAVQTIYRPAWVDPNARTFIGTTGIDRYDNWCDECEDHQPFCTLKEFKERMEEWWNSLDANQMEQITGCRQDKCPAGDNHQGLPKPAMNGGKTRAMTRNVKSGKNIMTADYDLQSS